MQYNHLNLIKENINLERQKGNPDLRPIREVRAKIHGTKLQKKFAAIKQEFQKSREKGERFIFRIERDSDKDIRYRKLGLNLIHQMKNNISIVEVIDENALLSHLSDFTAEKIAVTKIANYSDFANIEEFVFQTPEEKMGPLLGKLEINSNLFYILDIQLYSGDDSIKELHSKVMDFTSFLRKLEAKKMDDLILQDLVMIKINIKGEYINKLLEYKNVFYADLPQNSIYDFNSNTDVDIDSLPNIITPSPEDPYIAVIDSGILPTHPLLSGSVSDSLAFGTLESPFDENGHGTMVAGIIQFGDVYSTLKHNQNTIKLPFNLLNGRVTNKDNSFPDDKIVASVVKEAIDEFANNYACKIFNLSIGDNRTPYVQNTKMDPWSFILDKLNFEHNIAIVVSAGNYTPSQKQESILQKNYIKELLTEDDSSLIPPSLAISGLTVGSIAKDDIPYNDRNKLNHVAVASKNLISPFSRVGLGYRQSIKPETIAHGGNYSYNSQTKRINANDRNLGIFSTSIFNSLKGSWFESRSGTSFAAPYISHLLGTIKREIPEAKGNLLRALLINASYSNTITSNTVEDMYKNTLKPAELSQKIKMLQGYGEVRDEIVTKSTDNFVTMYFEGEIQSNKVNVFEIPIPEDVYLKKGKSKINITLAYNPPVRDTRIDYKGIHMSYALYRGLDLNDIIKYTCKPDNDEFIQDSLPKNKKKNKCKLVPSAQEAAKGTLLRTSHQLAATKKAGKEYKDTYYLVVKCQEKWYQGTKQQPYAIVVSIEHENEEANLYIPVQQRTQARTRTKIRQRR